MVEARPGDIAPAVSRAFTEVGVGPLQSLTPSPGVYEYEILTGNEETGWLRITYPAAASAEPGADTRGPASRVARPMEISARIGPFGDPARELALVQAVQRELRALAKQD